MSAVDSDAVIIVDDQDSKSVMANGKLSERSSNGNAAAAGSSSSSRSMTTSAMHGKDKAAGEGDGGEGERESAKRRRFEPPEYYHPVWSDSVWTYYDTVR